MKNKVAASLLVVALVVGAGIGYLGSTVNPITRTETLTTAMTRTTTMYSSEPPQLLGSRGFMSILGLNNSTSYSDFYYFEANSSNQQSFAYTFPVGTSNGTIYLSVNFSEYTPNMNAGGTQTTLVGGETCAYYKVTFQDGTSENMSACGTPFALRTYFAFTQHMHPQAGLAHAPNGTSDAFYFLVSER